MSQTTNPQQSTKTYSGTCRNGHEASRTIDSRRLEHSRSGAWLRCSDCGKITYCTD